jgi:hypothetical protein
VFFTPDYEEDHESVRFKHWTDYDAPSLTILHVCRQIKAEAEDVYLSKNLFVLPYNFDDLSPFLDPDLPSSLPPIRPLFSPTALKTFKNLSISYSSRYAVSLTMSVTGWAHAKRVSGVDYDTMTVSERQQYAHEKAIQYLEHYWDDIDTAFIKIHSSLLYLEMDLTDAYCPQGCCRVLTYIPFADYHCAYTSKTGVLRVMGLTAGEELAVQAGLQDLRDDYKYDGGLLCNPTNDPWEKWRVTQGEAETGTG